MSTKIALHRMENQVEEKELEREEEIDGQQEWSTGDQRKGDVSSSLNDTAEKSQ